MYKREMGVSLHKSDSKRSVPNLKFQIIVDSKNILLSATRWMEDSYCYSFFCSQITDVHVA